MIGVEGLTSADLISIIDGTSNSRQVLSPEGQNQSESPQHCSNSTPQLLSAPSDIPSTVPSTLFKLGHASCHRKCNSPSQKVVCFFLSPTPGHGLPQASSSHNAQGKNQGDVESCRLGSLFKSICTQVDFQLYSLGINRCKSRKLHQNMSLPYQMQPKFISQFTACSLM